MNLRTCSWAVLAALLFLLSSCLQPVAAQINNFKQYSIESGLPQSNVFCVIQDSRGYLWIGTDGGGLSRFDGLRFVNYGEKQGLAGNTVRALHEDAQGRIWAGTNNGLSVYDGLTFRSVGADEGLQGSTVLSIGEDASGSIWAGTDDGGVNRVTITSADAFDIVPFSTDEGLSSATIFDCYIDAQQRIWLGTFGGINVLIPSGESYDIETLRAGYHIPSDRILDLESDANGNLWVGTYGDGAFMIRMEAGKDSGEVVRLGVGTDLYNQSVWNINCTQNGKVWFGTGEAGLFRYFPEKARGDTLEFAHYTEAEGLPNNQILTMLEGSDGTMWFGSNGNGLIRFMGDRFSHFSDKDGLAHNQVMSVDQDENGQYWIATDGGGVSIMRLEGGQVAEFVQLDESSGLLTNFPTCLAVGRGNENKNVWIGTSQGLLKYNGDRFETFTVQDNLADNRVYCLTVDSRGIVWIGTAEGISKFDGETFLTIDMEALNMSDKGIFSIVEDANGIMWFGSAGGMARNNGDGTLTTFDEMEGLFDRYVNCLAPGPNGDMWIGTNGGGLYRYRTNWTDTLPIIQVATDSILSSNTINSMIFRDDTTLLVGTNRGFDRITIDGQGTIKHVRHYGFTDGFRGRECNDNAIFCDREGAVWFGTGEGLTRYDLEADPPATQGPDIHITALKLFFKDVDWTAETGSLLPWFNLPEKLTLPFAKRHLTFHYSGLSYDNPERVQFSYRLAGLNQDWSPPSPENKITFSSLSDGAYTFEVRAQNASGLQNENPAQFSFVIRPPWYRTTWFYVLAVVSIALGFYLFVKYREQKLKREKKVLEDTVAERTREVVKQKEEIETKNIEITDSINYAGKIQGSILPPKEERDRLFKDHFVLYRPKDIVSGDFYWLAVRDDKVLFTAADCTGHGVPGAFMSVIGATNLNEAVIDKGITDPAEILSRVRKGVITALRQTGAEGEQKDGMDMALCTLDHDTRVLQYAGANNSLYIVRKSGYQLALANGEKLEPILDEEGVQLFEIKANKQPVGYYTGEQKPYTTHGMMLRAGDAIYAFSDGFPDQFGGPKGKKYMYKRFKRFLMSIHAKDMPTQHDELNREIEAWMGEEQEQIDDICVFGVRV